MFETQSEEETIEVGRTVGATLAPGAVVLIEGPLGSGKTAFVRGLAAGLGGDPGEVSSPTFTLVQHYAGRVPVNHVDLYRLAPHEVPDLGLDDLTEDHVLAVEWPDRWSDAPGEAIRVQIEPTGDTARVITVQSADERIQ